MHLVFLLFRTYPYWAIPVALVFGHLGMHFARRGNLLRYFFWGSAAGMVLAALAWIGFRGDLHSDEWVRFLIGS